MGLQKTVNNSPAIGLSGQPVVLGQSVYTTMNFMSDGTVKAGAFAFAPCNRQGFQRCRFCRT